MPTVLVYTLLQIPGAMLVGLLLFLAVQGGWMGTRLAWIIMGIWLLKDALLYPAYRPALQGGHSPGPESLIGHTGIALTGIRDRGLIQIHGERWQARAEDGGFIARAELVRVVAHERLILVVRRLDDEDAKKARAPHPD